MNDEIKEILNDNDELLVRYKDNSFECFDTLPINVLDYITNLQQENDNLRTRIKTIKRLRKKQTQKKNKYKAIIFDEEQKLKDYKSRCEKAIDKLTIKQARFINEKDYVLDDNDLDEIMYILQNGSENDE